MDLARQNGMTTALVAAKSKFVVLAQPGPVPGPKYLQLAEPSTLRRLQAASAIAPLRPDLLVLHFADADKVEHA